MTSTPLTPLNPSARLGRLWFQWRSLSPVPFLLLMLILSPEFSPSTEVLTITLFLAGAAESLRLWAVGFAGSRTRTRGDTVEQLVHAGPFRWVRNPLYLANIVLYTSCTVLFGFIYLSIALFLFSCIEYHFIVAFEESILERTFGGAYRDYCSKVSRWLPSFQAAYPSSPHSFDLKVALRSERSTLLNILLVALAWIYKHH